MSEAVLNIIIAGTGGKGVISLSNAVRKLAELNNFDCIGASFKGGAQRMGSVYSELRLIPETLKEQTFSSQIGLNKVDVIIGLEPWECLRFAQKGHNKTRVICNEIVEKLYVQRIERKKLDDPLELLKANFNELILKNYSAISIQETGDAKQTNNFLLKDVINYQLLPFSKESLIELEKNV